MTNKSGEASEEQTTEGEASAYHKTSEEIKEEIVIQIEELTTKR